MKKFLGPSISNQFYQYRNVERSWYIPKTVIVWPLFSIFVLLIMLDGCTEPFTQGKALYDANCSRCHGMDGQGFEDLYPGILQSVYINSSNMDLACVITYGSTYLDRDKDTPQETRMPKNQHLTSVEVLNIMNYLSWEFGNKEQYKIETVMQTLQKCKP